MNEKFYEQYKDIPADKFKKRETTGKLADKKLATKPIGSFKDAMIRFRKNKSSVVAAVIILLLLLYALFIPLISPYDVTFRDGYYKMLLPRSETFAFLGWDGCKVQNETQAGYDYLSAIGYELNDSAVKEVRDVYQDANKGTTFYKLYVDSYDKVGFIFVDLTEKEYFALQDYQNQNDVQIIYPMPANYKTEFIAVSNGANLWYELADDSPANQGLSAHHDEQGNPIFVANYHTSSNPNRAKYDSKRIE